MCRFIKFARNLNTEGPVFEFSRIISIKSYEQETFANDT